MQYTSHYNLNLPEGTDIVNPLVQDNPNYTAIDTALYNNKLRVVETATHVKTGTNHAITLGDSDINQFKFVATGDYATGDTFTVDGVTVTPRIADGSSIPNGAFKINSTVLCILDGTILNIMNTAPDVDPDNIILSNGVSVEDALVKGSVTVDNAGGTKTYGQMLSELRSNLNLSKITNSSTVVKNDYLVYHLNKLSDLTFTNIILSGGATYDIECIRVDANSMYVENNNGSLSSYRDTLAPDSTTFKLIY